MKTFVINGNEFSTIDEFYDHIKKVFSVSDEKLKIDINYFIEILQGDYGTHNYFEPICIRWFNFEKSKEELGVEFVLEIIEVMLNCDNSGYNVKLELW